MCMYVCVSLCVSSHVCAHSHISVAPVRGNLFSSLALVLHIENSKGKVQNKLCIWPKNL